MDKIFIHQWCREAAWKSDINKTAREKAEAAATLLKRIDGVGKGIFAQKLALRLVDPKTTFSVPNYIKRAVLWACGI